MAGATLICLLSFSPAALGQASFDNVLFTMWPENLNPAQLQYLEFLEKEIAQQFSTIGFRLVAQRESAQTLAQLVREKQVKHYVIAQFSLADNGGAITLHLYKVDLSAPVEDETRALFRYVITLVRGGVEEGHRRVRGHMAARVRPSIEFYMGGQAKGRLLANCIWPDWEGTDANQASREITAQYWAELQTLPISTKYAIAGVSRAAFKVSCLEGEPLDLAPSAVYPNIVYGYLSDQGRWVELIWQSSSGPHSRRREVTFQASDNRAKAREIAGAVEAMAPSQ